MEDKSCSHLALSGGGYDNIPLRWWTEEEGKRVRRKLDLRIIPLLFFAYFFAFLDRSNIGNAKVAGMTKDLHMSDGQYEWLLTIYYIPYIIFQMLLILYKFFRPSVLMSFCVMGWGIAAMLQASAFNWQGMMAARFFMGMFEAGFCAAVALYLSFFYAREEVGRRFASFVVGNACASAVGGSLAFAIQSQAKHLDIAS